MEEKLKHLEFIQNVINRMAYNSFLLKGWSLTIISAIFALSLSNCAKEKFLLIAFFVAFVFWSLDAYFLRQEKLFRKLYENAILRTPDQIDFSMDTSPFASERSVSILRVMFSETLRIFHGAICLLTIATYFILK